MPGSPRGSATSKARLPDPRDAVVTARAASKHIQQHRQQGGPPMQHATHRRLTRVHCLASMLFLSVALLLFSDPLMAQEPKVTALMSKDLDDFPGKELLMITVEHTQGGSTPMHVHNAHALVYVLEGSVVE